MTHVYVFFLFALLLFFTIRCHKKLSIKNTIAIGFLLGIIAITRITDLIVFLIPLLWGVSSILELKEKIKFIINNRTILLCLVLSFILALLPQLIYWKMSYGSWIYNTGSKWNFLTPHFRVLIGGEKGLFIYTPINILFLIGLFYIRNKPFSVAILWFSILNAYILLSWHDWTYAASYACRAFVQSYAVMIFLTSLVVHEIFLRKNKILFFLGALYFIGVNLFQIKQYNEGIIHYHKNNFKYYSQIYLNSTQTPLQLSLLDTDDFIFFSSGKPRQVLKKNNIDITVNPNEKEIINKFFVKEIYYKISMVIKTSDIWNTNIYAKSGEKTVSFRLNRFGVNEFEENLYEFYFLPTNSGELEIGISSKYGCNANIKDFIVEEIR